MLKTRRLRRLAAILAITSTAADAQWYGKDFDSYFCASSLGAVRYNNAVVQREFGVEIGNKKWTNFSPTSLENFTLDTRVANCSTKTISCFEERLADGRTLFVYAIPRKLRVGQKYSVGEFDFATSYLYGPMDPNQVILIDAVSRKDEGERKRLWMVVRPRLGVTDLAFSAVPASFGVSMTETYRNVSCRLVSRMGLFWDVKVEPPSETAR